MPHVVFIAPYFLQNTNRYVSAFAGLPGVSLSVISADPASSIPAAIRGGVTGHYRVADVGDSAELIKALRALSAAHGPIDRLTGALEQLQLPMAEAREALDLPGLHIEGARRFRDKDKMKEVLRAHAVPVAASALVESAGGLRTFIDKVGYPIIVKPQAGLGSRSTHRIESDADLMALGQLGMIPTKQQPLQAEQFVRAREHTCETVTIEGKPVWRSGTRYFPTPLEVLENPWVQYCVLLPREVDSPWTDFAPINQAALDALFGPNPGPAGTALTHMEWFLCDDGAMLVNEVGVRPPGVHIMPMMGLAHETNMIADWAELIAFDRFTPRERKWAAGAAFFRGQGRGERIVSVEGLDETLEAVGDCLIEARTPKVGQARASGYEGEGHAIVKHATTEGVKQALLTLVEGVRIRYG